MTEPTQSRFDQELAKFARGELNPAAARELARTALESPAWFEDLTAAALAKSALASVSIPVEPVRRAWWRSRMFLATAAVVSIAVFVLAYLGRSSQKGNEVARVGRPKSLAATVTPKPTLMFSAGSSQPVLLAEDLQPANPSASAPVFRGQAQTARFPQRTGSIVLVEDGLVTIDLGSMDGLSKGSQVEVYRDRGLKDRVGVLHIATVFREQARGEAAVSDFKAQYIVRIGDSTHLQALLQRAGDLQSGGELSQARQIATDASDWANRAKVPDREKSKALELLARLDFQMGDLQSAQAHYRAAFDLLGGTTSANDVSQVQNDLAAIAMLRGDYELAEKVLEQGTAAPASQRLRAVRLNNLGVLAESRGDRQQAEPFYAKALDILPPNSLNERKVVETNLARLKESR